MDEENNRQATFFRIPKFAWIILGLWWALHIAIVLKVGVTAEVLGDLTVDLLVPLVVPLVLTTPVWFLARRSRRVAAIIFSIILLFVILSHLVSRISRVTARGAASKNHITTSRSGGEIA